MPNPGRGKTATLYRKLFKLDTTIPQTTAAVTPPEPDGPDGAYTRPPTIALDHDDRVLWPGSLQVTYFADAEATSPTAGPSGAKALRVHGQVYAETSGDHKLFVVGPGNLTAKRLYIDDRLVKQAEGPTASGILQAIHPMLKGFHRIRVDIVGKAQVRTPPKIQWQPPKVRRKAPIPSTALFTERSVATIRCRWDGGEAFDYVKPMPAPPGRHVLHYFAEDEAGHKEEERTLTIHVAPQ